MRSAAREYGMRTIIQGHTSGDYRISCVAFAAHDDIRDITRMWAFRILQPMMLTVGIEMWPGRLEIRPVALSGLVDMNCMVTRRKVMQIQLDLNPLGIGRKSGRAYTLALTILERNNLRFWLGILGQDSGNY